jgi:transcriptional repressor NF-X1
MMLITLYSPYQQTDEDVLASFETNTSELETKLVAISGTIRNLIADTGFCYSVEPVVHSDDGRVIRGSWTPVASGSKSGNDKKSLGTPLKTANAFAAFGGASAPSTSQQQQNVWGSLVGLAHNKVNLPQFSAVEFES